MKKWLIKKIKTYKDRKFSRNKKMEKNILESVEYEDECIFRLIAQSSEEKAIQFRAKNKQINFKKCLSNCPIYQENGCCNNYSSLSELNNVLLVEFT